MDAEKNIISNLHESAWQDRNSFGHIPIYCQALSSNDPPPRSIGTGFLQEGVRGKNQIVLFWFLRRRVFRFACFQASPILITTPPNIRPPGFIFGSRKIKNLGSFIFGGCIFERETSRFFGKKFWGRQKFLRRFAPVSHQDTLKINEKVYILSIGTTWCLIVSSIF